MNSKAKFTLTITAMVMVTLIAVVSIIAVFAARTQNLTSSIKVTYTSREVQGTASAKWLLGGVEDAQWQDMTNGKSETTLDFSKQLDDPTLSPGQEISLTEPEQYAIFEYNFTNDAARCCDLNLTYQDTDAADENVKITTAVFPQVDLFDSLDLGSTLISVEADTCQQYIPDKFTGTIDTTILPNSKLKIFVLVIIDYIGADASFSGNFNFVLNGERTAEYTDTFSYYTNGESAILTGVAKGTPNDALGFNINMLEDSELTMDEEYKTLPIKTIGGMAFMLQGV